MVGMFIVAVITITANYLGLKYDVQVQEIERKIAIHIRECHGYLLWKSYKNEHKIRKNYYR